MTARKDAMADRAVVLDGRTLQLVGHLRKDHPEHLSGMLVLVGGSGNEDRRLPVHIVGSSFQLRVPLDEAGLDLPQNSVWSVRLHCDGREMPIGFLPQGHPRSPVLPNPPSMLDGVTRSAVVGRTGDLLVRISTPQTCVHVDAVSTDLGRITVMGRSFMADGDVPVGIGYVARDLGIQHTQEIEALPALYSFSDIRWRVPTAELSTLVADAGVTSECVWDLHVVTARGSHTLGKTLGDLKDPRLTFRYATVSDVTLPTRDRFRPYWTRGGKLAIEHWFSPRP